MCGSTMGQVVGRVDTYFPGIGWWLIFGLGHMSEVSMWTGGKACGGSRVDTSSQMKMDNLLVMLILRHGMLVWGGT